MVYPPGNGKLACQHSVTIGRLPCAAAYLRIIFRQFDRDFEMTTFIWTAWGSREPTCPKVHIGLVGLQQNITHLARLLRLLNVGNFLVDPLQCGLVDR